MMNSSGIDLMAVLPTLRLICIDHPQLRQQILSNQDVEVRSVPCVLVMYPDGGLEKYEGGNAFSWVNSQIEQFAPARPAPPISSVRPVEPSTTKFEPSDSSDDDRSRRRRRKNRRKKKSRRPVYSSSEESEVEEYSRRPPPVRPKKSKRSLERSKDPPPDLPIGVFASPPEQDPDHPPQTGATAIEDLDTEDDQEPPSRDRRTPALQLPSIGPPEDRPRDSRPTMNMPNSHSGVRNHSSRATVSKQEDLMSQVTAMTAARKAAERQYDPRKMAGQDRPI